MSEQKKSYILGKYQPFPEFAWEHGIIRDTIKADQTRVGTKVAIPRCDHYSDYMTYEKAVWLDDIQEILKEHIDNFPPCPNELAQRWLDELRVLVGLKKGGFDET